MPVSTMGRHAASVLAIAAACFVGNAAAEQVPSGTDWPGWLQEAMNQEAGKLPRKRKVSVGDGMFTAKLAGKPTKPEEMEGGWYFSSNFGAPAPMECWVFADTVDPASMAANVADGVIQASATVNGPVGQRNVFFVDAGAYDQSPYLALEWMYSVGEAPEAKAGLAKVRVATVDSTTVACAHNYVGYRQTFAKVFERFVRSAEVASDAREYYEEIVVQTIGDQPVGVAHATFTHDDDGDTQILVVESSLIPVDNSTLHVSDTWRSSFSRPDGSLINQVVAKSENGALTMNLELGFTGEGSWLVSGTVQGKEISYEIDGAVQPMSELGQMLVVNELLSSSERSQASMDVWVPDADPSRFLPAGVVLDAQQGESGHGTLTIGPMAIAARFDHTGSLLNGSMQAGAAELRMERVWAAGKVN